MTGEDDVTAARSPGTGAPEPGSLGTGSLGIGPVGEGDHDLAEVDDLLVEEVSIDGMCGVY